MKLPLAALVAVSIATAASAQGGYTQEKHPELGLDFQRPRSYEAVPTQPTDANTILFYVEKERKRDPKPFRPELRFLRLEAPEVDPEAPRRTQVGARPGTFEHYFEERMQARWRVTDRVELENSGEALVFDYTLDFKKGDGAAWARSFETKAGSTVVLGYCDARERDEQQKIWRKVADSIERYEAEAGDSTRLDRFYERRDFSLPEYRIGVRTKLVDGWKADDTENFILVYSTRDEALLRIIKSELEAIREAYVELFPPAQEITAISTLRICKDRDEYIKYGGSKNSGGYFNPVGEELVFYDYENVDGKMGSGKADSRIVLYHEAFHQYVWFAVGKLAPHSWFNEGTGDYFSGANIRGGKVKSIGVNPWRIETIQEALRRGLDEDWKDILRYSQAEFYEGRRVGICYAQAWSMIYFLRQSRDVAKHPRWSKILDTYFETLKTSYRWETEKLAAKENPTPEDVEAANQSAREAALEKAFQDVDLLEIEQAWKDYTLDLKAPKR